MIVAVTGADGFVGRHVCAELLRAGITVRALVRRELGGEPLGPRSRLLRVPWAGTHDADTMRVAFRGVQAVIHLAARVHVMRDRAADPAAAFRAVNVEGTRRLAALAAEAGVARLLFASSVKAVGEASAEAWTEQTIPAPVDPYGISKREAELVLEELAGRTAMSVSVLRLPVVYGPGMRANMLRLFELVDRGWPVPLGGIRNRRSLVYVGNVAAAMRALLAAGPRPYELYFASDGEDVSTPELVRRIGTALGKRVRLLPAPVALLTLMERLSVPRLGAIAARLLGSLAVDSTALRARIGAPLPFTMDEGLRETAHWYRTRVPV